MADDWIREDVFKKVLEFLGLNWCLECLDLLRSLSTGCELTSSSLFLGLFNSPHLLEILFIHSFQTV